MVYIPAEKTPDGITKVIYTSKDDKSSQTLDALDWLACLVTHVPGHYEHTVRYFLRILFKQIARDAQKGRCG
jgi:hypothetical protein